MIANARMYAVSPEAAGRWRALLTAIVAASGISVDVIEHPAPAPLEDLWRRTDQGAVFMCGLPFSRSVPQPVLMAAPVPSPAEYGGEPRYWSELVVRRDSGYRSVSDTFGGRLALTVPGSQSGCVAALSFFMSAEREPPLFAEVIAPTVTPLGALSAVVRAMPISPPSIPTPSPCWEGTGRTWPSRSGSSAGRHPPHPAAGGLTGGPGSAAIRVP